MPRFTQEQLNEQFKRLPPALKDALFSTEVADKILTIGRKYMLNIEKTGFLAEETGYIILGLSRADEFVRMLAERIRITPAIASEIAKEINREILTPIREELRRAHALQITDVDLEKAGEILPHKHPGEIAPQKPVLPRPPTTPTPARPASTSSTQGGPPSATMPKAPQPPRPLAPLPKPSIPPAVSSDLIGQFPKPPPIPPKPTAPPVQAAIRPPIPAPMVGETKQMPRMVPKIPPIDLRGSKPPLTPPQTPAPAPTREAAPAPRPTPLTPKNHLANDPYREPTE